MKKERVLFVCMANINRSAVAEELYKDDARYEVRSAGVRAWKPEKRKLSADDIGWADRIFAADWYVAGQIFSKYPECRGKVVDINVPDEYSASNPKERAELEKLLSERLWPYLGKPDKF